MKDKKTREALKQAQEAAEQANKTLGNGMQELDEDELDAVAGGSNPYADYPRVPTQPIDPNARRTRFVP